MILQRAKVRGKTPGKGSISPLGLLQMNEQELIEFISNAGRFEVFSDGTGNFVCTPIQLGAILITPEAHEENQQFFRNRDS